MLMLPHTRPGGMAGLLEILEDHNGRRPARACRRTELEVDALLPTVDTAVLLGLLKLVEGDAILTPEGKRSRMRTFKAQNDVPQSRGGERSPVAADAAGF